MARGGIFAASVAGTVRITEARAVHLAVLMAGHWLAMRLVGIDVPLSAALAGLPVMFLVASLPIAPAGLGTTQAAAVTLFSGFAPGATEPLRQAAVLAYSLAFQAASTFAIGIIGLLCLRLTTHPRPGSSGTPQSKL